jgi:hypothetical protein
VLRLLGAGGGVERRSSGTTIENDSYFSKVMNELCATHDEITEWLNHAAGSNEMLPPLTLTADGRFTIEQGRDSANAKTLSVFVCYDEYSEIVETVEDIVSVVENNI